MPRAKAAAAALVACASNAALVAGLRARAAMAATPPRQAQLLRRAADSVGLYPLPLLSGQAALALENVG
jgi:hypothetical protein